MRYSLVVLGTVGDAYPPHTEQAVFQLLIHEVTGFPRAFSSAISANRASAR
jgi:hypothetical protein